MKPLTRSAWPRRDAVSLSGDLEDYLSRRLSPTLLYQYPTINKLAEHLAATGRARPTPSEHSAPAAQTGPSPVEPTETPAVVNWPGDDPASALSEDEAEAALLRKLLELGE